MFFLDLAVFRLFRLFDERLSVLDLTVLRQFQFFDAFRDPFKVKIVILFRIRGAGGLAPRERPWELIVETNRGCACVRKAPLPRTTRLTRFPRQDWVSLTGRIMRG